MKLNRYVILMLKLNMECLTKKRKEKITYVSVYRCEYEPVDPMLIIGSRDAVLCLLWEVGFGVVLDCPHLMMGKHGFVCCQVFLYSGLGK